MSFLKRIKFFIKKQTKFRIDFIIGIVAFFCLGIFITTSSFSLWPLYRVKENITYLFTQEKPIYGEFSSLKNNLFLEVFNKIRFNYFPIKELPDERSLIRKTTLGLIESFKDPYTYLEEIHPQTDLKVVGIMLDYNQEGLVGIREISKTSPAFKAGFRPNDLIVKVGTLNTLGKNVKEIKTLIKNSTDNFEMTVYKAKENELFTAKITKQETTEAENVSIKKLNSSGLYLLKINSFTADADDEFFKVLNNESPTQIKKLIIDLKDNTGGNTRVARRIIETFLEKDQIIMSEENRNKEKNIFKANGSKYPSLIEIPKVILVNNLTASSSEIFTLALRGNQKTPVIGEKTYGKGFITEELQVSTTDLLTLTVAKWFGPKDEFIDQIGIKPDYQAEIDILKQAEKILEKTF